jgi:cellulose synthase/poly-beta-1,6-N-acetylglucosamine synthase-like glycosyltransferase
MTAPKDCTINYQVAEFAWRIKNWVRPLGMHNLGLPCQLMGTGMAFPWKTIHSANIASGEIVEDLKLGMHLALAGQPAQFCPAACVTSQFPSTAEGAANQRQRWEQGHIGLILRLAPKTILRAILSRNGPALALALDMAVPPLALLVFLIAATCLTGTIAALLGLSTMPMLIAAASAVGLTSVLLVAWWRFGRDILPARALPQVVSYLLDKARLYARLSSRPGKATWVRTERDAPKDD